MQDMNMTETNSPQEPMGQEEGTPLDGIISTVDQLMADPKSITPETLGQLRMDLEDLKTVLDGGEQEPTEPAAPSSGGLAGMIGGK